MVLFTGPLLLILERGHLKMCLDIQLNADLEFVTGVQLFSIKGKKKTEVFLQAYGKVVFCASVSRVWPSATETCDISLTLLKIQVNNFN